MTDHHSVLLGFSGGVDSSTSAFLLKQQGYRVIGATFIVDEQWDATNREFAVEAAKRLGIEHIFVNAEADFREKVIRPYLETIQQGATPSPCPLCNAGFKFALLKKIADSYGAQYIATGHYADRIYDGTHWYLQKARDLRKDQSYMLYRLPGNVLQDLIFPLAGYLKEEVREIARTAQIPTAERPDSQGLCFAPHGYADFIRETVKNIIPGYFIDEQGTTLGTHRGYQLYTIGQRRGLGLTGNKPYFITQIDPQKNSITLGDYKALYREQIELTSLLLHGKYQQEYGEITFTARPRFSSSGHLARLSHNGRNYVLNYLTPNTQNAPGQHLVLYDGTRIAGGGIIQ